MPNKQNLATLVLINKNKGLQSSYALNQAKNIFEDDFVDTQEDIDEVKRFIKDDDENKF